MKGLLFALYSPVEEGEGSEECIVGMVVIETLNRNGPVSNQ
jgi:hypothetical protein